MTYQSRYTIFAEDKQRFISSNLTLSNVRHLAEKKDYRFLSNNKMLIEQEFQQVFASLKAQKENREEFWRYCYYCCLMLKSYYLAYDDASKVDQYQELADKIEGYCEAGAFSPDKPEPISFIESLGITLADAINDLQTTPDHISKIRSKISFLNMCRIYWAFCRVTLTSALLLAREGRWVDQLNRLLSKNINVDNIIKNLEAPNGVFRALSVGFFAMRFFINAAMLVKHTFFPSKQEKSLTRWERFCLEMRKRHADFLNDVVWGVVNGVTNYNSFFHISAPVAGWVTVGFLVFDVCLLLWRRYLAKQEYLTKKSQYLMELHDYETRLARMANWDEYDHCVKQCQLLRRQLNELELTWKTKNATFWFNILAAALLATGFAASMIFAPGVMMIASYALCVIAVSMYLSDAAYSQYKEKSLILEQAQLTNQDTRQALAAYQAARNEFIYTLVKNAILPGLVILTFAVSWQAGLVLTAIYIAYELWRAYNRYQENQRHLAAAEPERDEGVEACSDSDDIDDSENKLAYSR
jgi:hypothetical protein